jgi:hypothetical protein
LAVQFGVATGMHGALRSAIGTIDQETLRWEKLKPDPGGYQRVTEPHARGSFCSGPLNSSPVTASI